MGEDAMYKADGRLILSAGDLVGFLACEHLTELELAVARGQLEAPGDTDPELAVLFARGVEHEKAYLAELERQGLRVASIEAEAREPVDWSRLEAEVLSAMRAGADIIYQAAFFCVGEQSRAWRGRADFLRRIPALSELGPHLYEPEDTKLARHVKPGAILQLCNYAEHVARLQEAEPAEIHVVLGGSECVSFPLRDFGAYYRAVKQRFERALSEPDRVTYPDPCAHCSICRWLPVCDERRGADDHLSLVAGLGRDQARKLAKVGIQSLSALAASPDEQPVRGIGVATLSRLRRQARLQVQARELPAGSPPPYELLPVKSGWGLAQLPEPSPGDLYFDIEGDPHVGDGGLEYLLGVGWVEDGEFRYRAFWGHDSADEKHAFEAFIDFVTERRKRWPELHIYHYAPYEVSALGKLMGRHGTREAEVDSLLRARVLVDLYQVVRQALLVGTGSYSIKKLEPLYMGQREAAIAQGAASIVAYERWLQCQDPAILEALEHYNREDCESTWLLRDWLEARRDEVEAQGESIERRVPGDPEPSARVADEAAEVAPLAGRLLADLEGIPDASTHANDHARWLLAQLLEWHRREAKPEYWRFYRRVLECTERDLFDDSEAVAGLEYEGPAGNEARSTIHRYRFDPTQEHKLKVGTSPCDPARERAQILEDRKAPGPGTLVALDPIAGTLDLKRGNRSKADHPRALLPGRPIRTDSLSQALQSVARSVVEHGADGEGPFRAARDLLLRRVPRVAGLAAGDALVLSDEDAVSAAARLGTSLEGGCLPIQGPPGTGKSYTGARVIARLIADGCRVGITANSHAVIGNMLREVMSHGREAEVGVHAMQKADPSQGCGDPDVRVTNDNKEIENGLDTGDVNLVAGTPWLFSREALREELDYLVVDEAGQLSLANVIAVSTSARNLILIGDPQQLAQPSKGGHPPGAERSALGHLLDGRDTLRADQGLFLDRTWRMHPQICGYVSELAYEGRLQAVEGREIQRVSGGGALRGSGLRWLPVTHVGNRTASEEEAQVIGEQVRALLGVPWTNHEGETRPIELDDILVVAPYNAQVSLLAASLPEYARVGTVDKFQGQEAAAVFVSLAASDAENLSRGLEFLYSRNRLNVAISRARALAVVVASPRLLAARCRTVEQLRLVNGLCRFAELAEPI